MTRTLIDDMGLYEQDERFDSIFKETQGFEGDYTEDSGGPTMKGITQNTYDAYQKSKGFEIKDVKDITPKEVRTIAREEFYLKPKYDQLPDNVAEVMFDFGFNASPARATKKFQKIIGTKEDGIIGPNTIGAMNSFIEKNGEKPLLQGIVDSRDAHNKGLIEDNPDKYKQYENGWEDRIQKIKDKFDLSFNPFAIGNGEAQAAEIEGRRTLEDDMGLYQENYSEKDKGRRKLVDDMGLFEEGYNDPEDPRDSLGTFQKALTSKPTEYLMGSEDTTALFERLGKGFGTGVAGMVEGIGGVSKWMGIDGIGDSINAYADEMKQFYDVPDPDFVSSVSAGFGSMATFLIPGLGVSRGVQAVSAIPRLAAWLGASASAVMEASVEAGGAYNRSIAKGVDHKEASGAATLDFWANLPLLVFTNKVGIFGENGGAILKGLKSASSESVQEFSQQLIGNFATKDPLFAGALESAAVGAIVGGGTGTLMSMEERKDVEKIKAKDFEEEKVKEDKAVTTPKPKVSVDLTSAVGEALDSSQETATTKTVEAQTEKVVAEAEKVEKVAPVVPEVTKEASTEQVAIDKRKFNKGKKKTDAELVESGKVASIMRKVEGGVVINKEISDNFTPEEQRLLKRRGKVSGIINFNSWADELRNTHPMLKDKSDMDIARMVIDQEQGLAKDIKINDEELSKQYEEHIKQYPEINQEELKREVEDEIKLEDLNEEEIAGIFESEGIVKEEPISKEVVSEPESLVEEAKKFKTAKEFVGKQSQISQATTEGKEGKFWTVAEGVDKGFGNTINEAFVNESKLFQGTSSYEFLEQKGLMTDKLKTQLSEAEESKDPNSFYKITQDKAEKILKDEGYSGVHWTSEDDLNPTQYQIWDKNVIKTKQQLTDIYNKAQEGKEPSIKISQEQRDLAVSWYKEKIKEYEDRIPQLLSDIKKEGFEVEIDRGADFITYEIYKDGELVENLKGKGKELIDIVVESEEINEKIKRIEAGEDLSKVEMAAISQVKAQEGKVEKEEVKDEEKVAGLSKSITNEAIKEGLAEEFSDLPTYKTRDIKDVAERATTFIEDNYELAKKIALGESPEQGDLRSQELFTALRIKAVAEGDVDTIQELATSKTASAIATELGQRVQALDADISFDPVKTIQKVVKQREESIKQSPASQKKIDEYKQKLEEIEGRVKELKAKIEKSKGKKSKGFGSKNKVFTQERLDAARKSLKQKLGGLHSGVDPTAVIELTEIGGFYFEGGIREFSAWSDLLVKEFGNNIKPHLNNIWKNVKKEYGTKQVENSKEKIGKLSASEKPINFAVQQLAETLVSSGIVSRDKLTLEVQKILQESNPDITLRETADLISGYGKYSRLNQDQAKAILRDIKGQLQQISKLEDLQKGKELLKTGIERRKVGVEERRLIKLVEKAKRKYNVKTVSQETLLKSLKTRLTNEAEKLNDKLEAMDFEVQAKRTIALDAEAQKLKQKRDEIKSVYNASRVKEGISKDEVSKIVNLSKEAADSQKKVTDKDDWTADNAKEVEDFFDKRNKLEEYVESLKPKSTSDILNKFFDYMRASILASPRILRNSFLYQVVPGIERTITKRLVTGAFSDADIKSGIVEKLLAKLSGIKPSRKSMDFVRRQTAMAARIYHNTGIDISRLDKMDSTPKFFGERVGKFSGKGIIGKYAKFVSLAPKWMAGGTDMLFANIGRADTAIMMSKEIAKIEALQGILPEGVTQEQRADQLLKDSYSFNPKDKRADIIREAGIMDAHMMNNTQPGWWSDKVIEFRRMLSLGKLNFGKVFIPFAKIANVVVAEGVKTASGYGISKSVYDIGVASRKANINDRAKLMRASVTNLVRYVGISGAAFLLAALLDDDDYIGAYSTISRKDYAMARARGAGTNYVRFFGKWIALRYLPMINIPISAIMTARQAKKKGKNPVAGYLVGVMGQILDAPGIKEVGTISSRVGYAVKSDNLEKMAKSMKLDWDGLSNWAKVRMIPSVLSYDVWNALFPKDAKYDFMGREIEKGAFKEDKSNEITLEFNRLSDEGFFPTISKPTGKYAVLLEEKLGEEEYAKVLSGFQKEYARKVLSTMNTSWYKRHSDEKKKKDIDKIRKEQILDKLKKEK